MDVVIKEAIGVVFIYITGIVQGTRRGRRGPEVLGYFRIRVACYNQYSLGVLRSKSAKYNHQTPIFPFELFS